MAKKTKQKKQRSFSKTLLIQETILIWLITFICLGLALLSILTGYVGDFTWLATMIGFPWTAYGASQAFYYHKSQKENSVGGLTYDLAM
jgi:hypothetical protein